LQIPNKIQLKSEDLGNVHIIRINFGGRGGQRFVTKPCKIIGICTVFCYEGGGSENPENRVTYYVDVPLLNRPIKNQMKQFKKSNFIQNSFKNEK
jgi:hypothetical protein